MQDRPAQWTCVEGAEPETRGRLTLARRPGEGVRIRVGTTVICVRRGKGHRLLIDAPLDVSIVREELVEADSN